MRNTATKAFIFLAFIVTAATSVAAQRNEIDNIKWDLIAADGRTVTNTIANLETKGSSFTGNTGCNSMAGTVTFRGRDRIDFTDIRATERACRMMAGSLSEEEFLRALRSATRYTRTGDRLDLFDRRGRNVLRFQAERRQGGNGNAHRLLAERKWILESIANRRNVRAIAGAFVNFDPDRGSAGGNTSCNVFGGEYTANGSTISIRDIVSTMRACEEGNKMEVERLFLDGLRNADRYEIRNNRLQLFRGQRLLLTFRGERK